MNPRKETVNILESDGFNDWENITLSAIARELAGANGMSCMYESAYDPFYKRVEQRQASDIEFLSRRS